MRQLSGWQLRALLAATTALAVATAVGGETAERLGPLSVLGTLALVLGMLALPGTAMTTAFLLVLGLAVLDRADPWLPQLVALAALLHAVHLLAGLCALGPPSTRFDVAALVPTLRRWALAQPASLPVVAAVWWVGRRGGPGSGVPDVVEAAAGLVALLVLLALVALARRRLR